MASRPVRPARTAQAAVLAALLLAAGAACGGGDEQPPSAAVAPPSPAGDRVGTLSIRDAQGPRACTASVVHSPRRNLLVTAAHCVQSRRIGLLDGLVFTPGYRNGYSPYGSWPVQSITVDPRWAAEDDPEYDVAFVTVRAIGGREVEDAVGGNPLATGQGVGLAVSVTGYPNESDEPITCSARTSSQSPTQERFDCGGYTNGTSGSPWVTPAGAVVGVIGGYQEGGETDGTSYSVAFDERVAELYRRATA
ncbi:trypsin-like peptidase domain-containing protein [Kitasatospora sp. CM 4170]|uniref:Trypsin-like serine peptidase n=1 Tax=Kitasatospora aburaviensis TaxID=67265 RepID=A0ABW1EUF2_9ACTN|nr:trypsin-like peptidase domain-containing protein [Kitasatospora sp. CM 4170]WNM45675.1 trypsin-like peptidase domain-containing protein [Kitasatospora sp. CM 4170]